MFESLAEKLKKMRETKPLEEEVTFKPYEEVSTPAAPEKAEEPQRKPTPVITGAGDADGNIELKVVKPASFEEVSDVADYLLEGCTVVLNLELLDSASTLRMLDFLNGVTYSTDGDIKNVARCTYIITPHNVDVSDDK
jgi:cell division inhibitor SepF